MYNYKSREVHIDIILLLPLCCSIKIIVFKHDSVNNRFCSTSVYKPLTMSCLLISIFHVLMVWMGKSIPWAKCSIGGDEACLVARSPRDGFSHPHQEHMIDTFSCIFLYLIVYCSKTINKQRDLFLYSKTRA